MVISPRRCLIGSFLLLCGAYFLSLATVQADAPPRPAPGGPGDSERDSPSAVLATPTAGIYGDLRQWHRVTVAFEGPQSDEKADPNPFLDYRLDVTFHHAESGRNFEIPGYFAADGSAGETGATSGSIWRVHFTPPVTGRWTYETRFVSGPDVAVTPDTDAGHRASLDGNANGVVRGDFLIEATDKLPPDNRGRGRLNYVGDRYLQWEGSGEYFLKQGADSPENLLAYADFDGDFTSDGEKDEFIKTWEPHVRDWQTGDPTWRSGLGKGLIGAINYLASEGLNSISFLTMNINGDDRNVFPYLAIDQRERFDVSRLDQWEIVFTHADTCGLHLHFKTQETENELLLDGGAVGRERKLYYRELIARFGHHLALNWNLGEENDKQTDAQRIAMAAYFHAMDPYRHPIVVHTFPGAKTKIYEPLLGKKSALTGVSLQTDRADFREVFGQVSHWIAESTAVDRPWVVAVDEPGDASLALVPDSMDATHNNARTFALWGTLMAGGAGNEWYFGYKNAHSDLTLEDFRSRDLWWDQCRHALEFFTGQAVPFWSMKNANALIGNEDDSVEAGFCLATNEDGPVVIYLPSGGTVDLDLSKRAGNFSVRWFDPRNGGAPQTGSVSELKGGATSSIGLPPSDAGLDWVALIAPTKRLLFIRGAERSGGHLEARDDEARTEQLADIYNSSTRKGNHGWASLRELLERDGYQVEQIEEPLEADAPSTGQTSGAGIDLATLKLDRYAVIVFGSNNAKYDAASVDALEDYVRRGGGALFISDTNFGSDWGDAPDSDQQFLDRFGLEMNQDRGTTVLSRSTGQFVLAGHPIFQGVEAFDGEGVSPGHLPAIDPPPGVTRTRLAAMSGDTRNNDGAIGKNARGGTGRPSTEQDGSLISATLGDGRVLIHFDRNTFFNENGAGTDLFHHDNARYATNLFRWLSSPTVPVPPTPPPARE